MTARVRVVVTVVTYRRPGQLICVLESIDRQSPPTWLEVEMSILVVDNSPDLEAREVISEVSARLRTTVTYVPLGAGNIAAGRNEALRRIPEDIDFVAFIDDDEVADPGWLGCLLSAQRTRDADIVTGPVLASYPPTAPGWLRCDAFYSVVGPDEGAFVVEAVTGNALLRGGVLRELALSFDEGLGGSGGEDQLFFRTAHAGGARLWFEPTAVVRETVPLDRLNLRYLLRREYRKGNTLGLLDRSRPGWPGGRPGRRVLSSAYWAVTGLAAALGGVTARDRQARAAGLMRLFRSIGMLSGLRGQVFQHYTQRPAEDAGVLALVLTEDPDYQQAGHSQYLAGYVSHYRALGLRVFIVVTESRVAFLLRRKDQTVYRARGVVDVLGWQVTVHPRLLVRWTSWTAFRAAPRPLQQAVDRVRTAVRSGQAVDHSLGRELDDAQQVHLHDVLQRERPDVVMFSSPFSVPAVRHLPDSVRAAVLICHDVVSARATHLRARGYQVSPPDYDEANESGAMLGMSAVAAIQWDDAEVFRRLAPEDTEVVVCPVAVRALPAPRDPRPDRCLFVGSGSLPNVDGLNWFLQACWPAIRTAHPTAELHVVGTVCARVGPVPAGVVLRGEVAELAPEYARASVVLVPLRTGSGLKVKIVEGICNGAAVVATEVGAQGLSRLWPVPFLVADDAAAYSAAVVQVLADPALRRHLEQAARATAAQFSPERAFADLDRHLARRGALRRAPDDPPRPVDD
jgi:hypothetical protein